MENSISWQNKFSIVRKKTENVQSEICVKQTDMQLVSLVLTGNEAAFEEIFERHKRLVAIFAARYFRQPQQIEEIIQITFTKAYFELKSFRGKNDFSLPGWLGKIASNVCLDAIKKNKRKPENFLSEFSENEGENLFALLKNNGNIENDLVGRDLAEKLLAKLPPSDRALLQMLFVEEMSVAEVAEITGHSKANIKIRTFRARRALRKILEKFL